MLDAHYAQGGLHGNPAYQLSPKHQQLVQRNGIHYLHDQSLTHQYQHDGYSLQAQ